MRTLSTIAPFNFDFDPSRFLRAYKALGCTAAQFYRNRDKPPSVAEAMTISLDAGMPFDSIHGVFGLDLDPSSPDESHRRYCLSTYEAEGRLALELGCNMVVVHPAAPFDNEQPRSPAELADSATARWPHAMDFMHRLADVADDLEVTFLIENLPPNCRLGQDVHDLAQRLRRIACPRLRMCFDTGHAHVTGDVATSLNAAAEVVAYIHVHDNDGSTDDHRLPGDGTIDWGSVASALGTVPDLVPCMFEVFLPERQIEALWKAGRSNAIRRTVLGDRA